MQLTSRFVAAHAVSNYNIGGDRRVENNIMTHGVNDNRHSVVSKFDDSENNDNDDEETVYVIEYNEEDREKGRNTDGKDKCYFCMHMIEI